MSYFVGVDPDTTKLTSVVVDDQLNIERICLIRAPKGVKGRSAVVWMMNNCSYLLEKNRTDFLLTHATALAVEGQQIYSLGSSGAKPQDIVQLASVAGAVYGILCSEYSPKQAYFPLPQEWKGSVKKGTHQARLLKRLGVPYRVMGGKGSEYPVPTNEFMESIAHKYSGNHKMNPGDWKDINDSLGLAVWARDTYINDLKKSKG